MGLLGIPHGCALHNSGKNDYFCLKFGTHNLFHVRKGDLQVIFFIRISKVVFDSIIELWCDCRISRTVLPFLFVEPDVGFL